ncbi:MAG: UDP-glucose/GDP-mannose dehydrogenase family protein, partial [Planctomycetota bacterium]|nr:UDP-glucose/GDP-mannose dehydrogenase family protein [Planctomycetota bacterium]
MRIAVVGTGYVGLVAGTCFAESGNTVTCIDIDQTKVDNLNEGKVPIYEPGLEELLHRNMRDSRLSFTTDYSQGVPNAQVIFIAVGTPPGEDGGADVKYVLAAARLIAENMSGYTVIVNKSTVPVGTAEKVTQAISEVALHPFDVVSNPEFLKEGAAIGDFLKPNRVVIGANSDRAARIMAELYEPFVRTGNPILQMDVPSAELTKYAANAMLATRISFMNEIASLCAKVGANIDQVRAGIGSDERIGSRFLFAGVGYGGSCFPKDVKALVSTAGKYDLDFKVLRS